MPNHNGSAIILVIMKNSPKTEQQKVWQIKPPFPVLQQILARESGVSLVAAQLLINRGIYTVEQCRNFFDCALDRLHPPSLLKDMEAAVARITGAVRAQEKILIYGDYDADGITSTVLLVLVIRYLGGVVEYYVPDRLEEGYGLHLSVLQQYKEKGIKLVVTVDCGISALQEAVWASANGLDLVITDHHVPPPCLPQALAVINPKRADCGYPFKDLAGVGVALKLAQALLENHGAEKQMWQEYLDLCCLGTIADVVPLHGENRTLVKHGLARLAATGRPGLQALKQVSGIKDKDVLETDEVSFRLAPRLNAAGRIAKPDLAVRLLLSEDTAEAWELANELQSGNNARQKIEAEVLQDALAMLNEQLSLAEEKIIVLAAAHWHPGVIGIVAARLMKRFYRPVLLISLDDATGTGKGSARSIPSLNIYDALTHCQEYLLNYGGHAVAAGFSLPADNIEDFSRKINQYAAEVLDEEKMAPRLSLDLLVELSQVSEELVKEIELMQPFGHGNPLPLLGCREASVSACRGVGKDAAHLKMLLQDIGRQIDVIGFRFGAYAEVLATNESVDLAFVPGLNEYNGRRSLQLEVKDLGIPALLELTERSNNKSDAVGEHLVKDFSENVNRLYIPEFINKNLYDDNHYNDRVAEMPSYVHEGGDIPEIIDWRDAVGRQAKLGNLVADEHPTLILTACGYQTIELAHFLELSYPFLQGKVACCHELLTEKALSDYAVKFQKGEIKILTATPAMASSLNIRAERLIIYHLPYSRTVFNNAISMVKPQGCVYLFFGADDLLDNSSYLAAMAPDRDCLARFYTIVRRRLNDRGRFALESDRIVRSLTESGCLHVREYTVQVAVRVLAEIDLLTANKEGESIHVSLLPGPKQKQDLLNSQTYRMLHRVKAESNAWMQKILQAPLNTVNNLI